MGPEHAIHGPGSWLLFCIALLLIPAILVVEMLSGVVKPRQWIIIFSSLAVGVILLALRFPDKPDVRSMLVGTAALLVAAGFIFGPRK